MLIITWVYVELFHCVEKNKNKVSPLIDECFTFTYGLSLNEIDLRL